MVSGQSWDHVSVVYIFACWEGHMGWLCRLENSVLWWDPGVQFLPRKSFVQSSAVFNSRISIG